MTVDVMADLLRRSASGDAKAFMQFYDATSTSVFTLALARARCKDANLDAHRVRQEAESEAAAHFNKAWARCSEQPSSGLSPVTWLLTLGSQPPGADRG